MRWKAVFLHTVTAFAVFTNDNNCASDFLLDLVILLCGRFSRENHHYVAWLFCMHAWTYDKSCIFAVYCGNLHRQFLFAVFLTCLTFVYNFLLRKFFCVLGKNHIDLYWKKPLFLFFFENRIFWVINLTISPHLFLFVLFCFEKRIFARINLTVSMPLFLFFENRIFWIINLTTPMPFLFVLKTYFCKNKFNCFAASFLCFSTKKRLPVGKRKRQKMKKYFCIYFLLLLL